MSRIQSSEIAVQIAARGRVGMLTEVFDSLRDIIAAWPELNGTRRLFRFRGMVANDGKRMLVGLTSTGKKG